METPKYWRSYRLRCPDTGNTVRLLTEWREKGGEMVLSGMNCDCAELRDLSGQDCSWNCWGKIFREKRGGRR